MDRIVIVGAGLAGGAAARELRAAGFDGQVTMIGAEHHPAYERPPLSKEYLRGESPAAAAYVEPEEFWAEHEVRLLRGHLVENLDLAQGRVELADGDPLAFDRLMLGTGARPRTLDVPGSELDGVASLRTLEDSDDIRSRARKAARVLVIGGGWIGCEASASLRALGCEVTLAFNGRMPLERTLGPEIAAVYSRMHADRGVDLRPDTRIVAVDGSGRVHRARTESGEWLECDLVVAAVGVRPRLELAERAGLTLGDGIIVDGSLATSDPRVFAAGDVASAPYPLLGRPLRVEHWGTALAQGAHAARAMLGAAEPYDEVPYFFSDQYDTGMEFWGDPERPGRLVVRGELDSRAFTAFWLEEGRVSAVLNMHVHHQHDAPQNAHGAGDDHDHDHDHDHGGDGPAHQHEHEHEHVAEHTEHEHEPAEHSHAGGHVDRSVVESLLRSRRTIDVGAIGDPDVPLEKLLNDS